MPDQDSHLSDEQLLLLLEGEFPQRDAKAAREHVEGCWQCRSRRQELERAIADFVKVRDESLEGCLPPAEGPRALLRVRLEQLASESGQRWRGFPFRLQSSWAVAACVCAVLAIVWVREVPDWQRPAGGREHPAVTIPNSRLTPGATVILSRQAVCSQENIKNKAVPVALQRRVFEEYGIPLAEPRAYEIDYLVTPALGGAEDIRNLWPQSYSSEWSATVKDALEDRLREMVCDGTLDLSQAQREIANNWVGAYQKYFRTDRPLKEHTSPQPAEDAGARTGPL